MNIKTLLSLNLIFILLPNFSYASEKSSNEQLGDILAIGIPTLAYGTTWASGDKEGRKQFYRSFAATTAINATLKLSGIGDRPLNDKTDSFPSGHTAYAFQGATFIHKRYGLKYGIPAYIGAAYVADSRREKHNSEDIVAGVLLGVASGWYFTKRKSDFAPVIKKDSIGIRYKTKW